MSSFESRSPRTLGGDFAPLLPPVESEPEGRPGTIFEELLSRSAGNGSSSGLAGDGFGGEAAAIEAIEEATREAHARGVAEGREQVAAECHEVAAGFARALEDLARSRREMAEHHERELLAVAVRVAEKILAGELQQNPDRWLGMIREGISRTLDREHVRIRVGRELHRYLGDHLGELRALLEDVRDIELVDDTSLGANGCVIETTYGDLDLCVESQLEALGTALQGRE